MSTRIPQSASGCFWYYGRSGSLKIDDAIPAGTKRCKMRQLWTFFWHAGMIVHTNIRNSSRKARASPPFMIFCIWEINKILIMPISYDWSEFANYPFSYFGHTSALAVSEIYACWQNGTDQGSNCAERFHKAAWLSDILLFLWYKNGLPGICIHCPAWRM